MTQCLLQRGTGLRISTGIVVRYCYQRKFLDFSVLVWITLRERQHVKSTTHRASFRTNTGNSFMCNTGFFDKSNKMRHEEGVFI